MANKKAASKKIVSLPIPLERWFNDAKRIEELRIDLLLNLSEFFMI